MSRITPPANSGAAPRRGRIGIKDVARRAGVSQGTVSNVLNHPDRVSPARREEVERAIKELGFVRHEAARHLRAGYTRTLGLLLLDAWNPGFLDIARGVEDTTADGGWSLLLSNTARDLRREQSYLRLFAENRVAGLIVIPHDQYAEGLHTIRAGGVPVVVVDRAETGDEGLSVAVDDVTGGWLAARHLIDLGHRHIAFVGDESAATPVHDRLTGVRKAVAETETEDPVRLDILPSDLTAEAGRSRGEQLALMSAEERPTAIAAAIDLLAFGVLQALLSYRIRVPEDVSLIGYDDIPFTRQLSVPLTTVRRPHYEMGVAAAQLLTTAIRGDRPPNRHVLFEPELIIRDSTAPYPAPGELQAISPA